jgi:hypothetical protein
MSHADEADKLLIKPGPAQSDRHQKGEERGWVSPGTRRPDARTG